MWQRARRRDRALSADDALRCIILRGAGEKAFSPGNDIGEFATRAREQGAGDRLRPRHARRRCGARPTCRHPLVAQIHGICVGGGLEIAALCDLRICGESSRFGAPIKNLGLVMAYAEMAPLVRLVGGAIALEILLEGRIFGAAEAMEKRLVTRVVPMRRSPAKRAPRPGASPTARRSSRAGTSKFARRSSPAPPLTAAEHDECFDCFDTEDFRDGYAAFLAKQPTGVPRADEHRARRCPPARSPA